MLWNYNMLCVVAYRQTLQLEKKRSEKWITFYVTDRIRLLSELLTSAELFFFLFSFSFLFFLQRSERDGGREPRRLVPVTVVLPCDWWKPVARLMSVLESFLLPLLCALIGQVWTGLVDLCHLLNIPTLSDFLRFPCILLHEKTQQPQCRDICADFTPGMTSSLSVF